MNADKHSFLGFTTDDLGFVVGHCECGWDTWPCPGEEDATDALMDHAGESDD